MPCSATLEPSSIAGLNTPAEVWDWVMRKQLAARQRTTPDGSLWTDAPVVEVIAYIELMERIRRSRILPDFYIRPQ
ncbi:hypothetical protein TWF696_003745 [Orbilia brochopaga]|uniref:Uncharacterized protein n=1 Tax=Orbilia brochopaga TaxID=3140254 RepID=A0AAV9V4D1_9PEZI